MSRQGLAEPEDEDGQFAEDPDEEHCAEQRGHVPVAGRAYGEALCDPIEDRRTSITTLSSQRMTKR